MSFKTNSRGEFTLGDGASAGRGMGWGQPCKHTALQQSPRSRQQWHVVWGPWGHTTYGLGLSGPTQPSCQPASLHDRAEAARLSCHPVQNQ